ncbi:hypothetical protein GPECTOR_1022g290 [Gonium pectorale]|uniref:Uncharacterized protein n=1 Tax=Gonium pectorale TaxID=33097 RepID=A0A150FTV2_GONPE|nr:hypothetical protein GPECTOR_1022g290 [Gonium pectorale]|eukprot:KXZ40998.1 hypothetical protein GPECTOR_1022g290 [Gonium pectorale]
MLDTGSALLLITLRMADKLGLKYERMGGTAVTISGRAMLMVIVGVVELILAPGTIAECRVTLTMMVVTDPAAQHMFDILVPRKLFTQSGMDIISYPQPSVRYRPFLRSNDHRRGQLAYLPTVPRSDTQPATGELAGLVGMLIGDAAAAAGALDDDTRLLDLDDDELLDYELGEQLADEVPPADAAPADDEQPAPAKGRRVRLSQRPTIRPAI